jgi:hypothetical protein
MKTSTLTLSLALGCGTILRAGAVQAESPYERDQRQQLEKYQQEHGLSPQVQQTLRWQAEWRQQHPNEPMPNLGVLEKLHRQETLNNISQGFAKMRQERQAKLQHDYLVSKQHQAQILASQRITWTPQQWQAWDRQYDQEQQRRAQDYIKASALSSEMAREEATRDEAERIRNGTN